MSDTSQAVKDACEHYGYKWPKELPSGVMFFNGARITVHDFTKWARNFK